MLTTDTVISGKSATQKRRHKKKMKKLTKLFLFPFMIMLMLVMSMQASAAGETKLDCTSVTLAPGHSVIVNMKNPQGPTFWSSDNKKVATVKYLKGYYDEKTKEVVGRAKITAKGKGNIKIKVENNKKIYEIKVKVKKGLKTKLNCSKKTLKVGKSFKLKLINPVNPEIKVVSYNKKNVSVEPGEFEKGTQYVTVNGIKPGTTKIKIKDKNKTYICKVKVVR